MKQLILFILATFFSFTAITGTAQVPQGIPYQAVARDGAGQPLDNHAVKVRFSILDSIVTGPAIFVETHTTTTSQLGLFTANVGMGTVVSGSFSNINWGQNFKFLKVELDTTGIGNNYSNLGTQQMMSVPYAFYSGSSASVAGGGAQGQILTYCNGVATWTTGGQCPPAYPTGSVFCASGPTAVVDVLNPATGKTWMDRNLGATQVATSSTDTNAYGDLYQWGRRSDGHQCRNSSTTTTLSSTDQPPHGSFILVANSPYDWRSPENVNLWQGVNGVNNPCPNGYRIPTVAEWSDEIWSWSSCSALGAFTSTLKLTLGGIRQANSGNLIHLNSAGYYWNGFGTASYIGGGSCLIANGTLNAHGHSVRCIKN